MKTHKSIWLKKRYTDIFLLYISPCSKEACKKYTALTVERLPQVDPIPKIWTSLYFLQASFRESSVWHHKNTSLKEGWEEKWEMTPLKKRWIFMTSRMTLWAFSSFRFVVIKIIVLFVGYTPEELFTLSKSSFSTGAVSFISFNTYICVNFYYA